MASVRGKTTKLFKPAAAEQRPSKMDQGLRELGGMRSKAVRLSCEKPDHYKQCGKAVRMSAWECGAHIGAGATTNKVHRGACHIVVPNIHRGRRLVQDSTRCLPAP